MSTTTTLADNARLAVTAKEVGGLLGIAERSVWRRHAAGDLPSPIKLGKNTRWRLDELREWLAAGAPDRLTWEATR